MVLVAESIGSRRRKTRNAVLITLFSIVIVTVVTMFISLGYYVQTIDTVFPNVWAEGINVSGLTEQQARQALIDGGYEQSAAGISLTVSFPYDISFTVTGDDVGLTLNAAEAARAAFNLGRDGTFIQNEITFIKTLLGRTSLNELSHPNYDPAIIREMADEYTHLFNESLFDHDLEISDNLITVIKGTGYAAATSDEVYNFAEAEMKRAIEQHMHHSVRFIPETNTDDHIDLLSIFEYIHKEPVSSRYDSQLGDPGLETYDPVNMGATESSEGRTFDLDDAEERIRHADNGSTVLIPIITLYPEVTQEDIKAMLYRDVLAERQAWQSSPAPRAGNIRLAAEAVNGVVLQPGEQFSFNAVVGKRTEENGYQEANTIINGVLQPALGGGICQVSSTIYSALLQTDIEIVSRTRHGLRVNYLPGGQDATVAYGSLDFKFRNSMDYPIRIEATTSGSVTVTVKIYGTRVSDVYYEVISEEREDSPIEMITIERPVTPEDEITLKPGEKYTLSAGNSGSVWEVWRYHYSGPDFENPDNRILDRNGEHLRTLYSTNIYPMRQRVILYSTEEAPPPPPEQPTAIPPIDVPPATPPAEQPTAEQLPEDPEG